MPFYEYRCSACGHELEVLQKMSAAPLSDCPSCGKATLTKLVSAAGFQLKGSGWYVTDFRDGDKGKKEKGDSKSTSTATSGTGKEGGSGNSSESATSSKKAESKSTEASKSSAKSDAPAKSTGD